MDHEFSVLKRYKRVTLILNVVLHPNKSNLNPQTSLLQAEGLSPLSFSALRATQTNGFPNVSFLNCYIEFLKKKFKFNSLFVLNIVKIDHFPRFFKSHLVNFKEAYHLSEDPWIASNRALLSCD